MTVTATKPSKTKNQAKGDQPRPAADIQAAIDAAIKKRDNINPWESEKIDKAEAGIQELRVELELAHLAEMPLPAPQACSTLKFDERSVSIEKIVVTGNHRELDNQADNLRLARTLQTVGLQQRIGLRDQGDKTFELIYGSRRLAAAKLNG